MAVEIALTPSGYLRLLGVEEDSSPDRYLATGKAATEEEPPDKSAGLRKDETLRQPEVSQWLKKVSAGFAGSSGAGLFRMAASKPDIPLTASMLYWYRFAESYMTELCRLPETAESTQKPLEPPPLAERQMLALSAPPMQGGEYLDEAVISKLWSELDQWVRGEVNASQTQAHQAETVTDKTGKGRKADPGSKTAVITGIGKADAGDSWTASSKTLKDEPGEKSQGVSAKTGNGLAAWLQREAPLWHQVGRVCFHLAENRTLPDPDYPFAFLATYAPQLSAGGRVRYQPLSKALREYAGEKNRGALVKLLTPVYRASEKSDFVRDLVDTGDIYHPLEWTAADAYYFLSNVRLFEESGILVRIPDWWRKRARPKVSVTIGEKTKGGFNAEALLDFKAHLALDGEPLTEDDARQIMAADQGLVMLRGQWVEVNQDKLAHVLEHWKQFEKEAGREGISFIEAMRLLAGAPADLSADDDLSADYREWTFVSAGEWLSGVLEQLRTAMDQPSFGENGFKGELRPYQKQGHNWLYFLSGLGLGACLADDMGLGKTIQVIALLLTRKKEAAKPSLLVLPASLLANWKAELERFAPGLKTNCLHLSEMSRDEVEKIAREPERHLPGMDLILTTYGMLKRQEWLHEQEWQMVIIDEAQAIKNPASRQTRAVKKLKAGARIALTGTPLENRLTDLWSIFDFLCPGLLGSQKQFKDFVKNLEESESDRFAPLRNLVRPYILRRLKTDRSIITDLPAKTEMKVYCGLSKKQAALYTRTVEEMKKALDEAEGIERRGLVLSYLMRFKQICNHPDQPYGGGGYAPALSGKFSRLEDICEEIASRQEKVLVFTQFREMTEPIALFLEAVFGRSGLVLHGQTAIKKRQVLVDSFAKEDGPPFFVLSLKAGGTGLNLTAASHVIHFDRWWNPAVENQATDRAFRIGQCRNVLVHKFICRGTIEEKIDQLIDNKSQLADYILSSGAEKALTEMSDRDLINMVALDLERATL